MVEGSLSMREVLVSTTRSSMFFECSFAVEKLGAELLVSFLLRNEGFMIIISTSHQRLPNAPFS